MSEWTNTTLWLSLTKSKTLRDLSRLSKLRWKIRHIYEYSYRNSRIVFAKFRNLRNFNVIFTNILIVTVSRIAFTKNLNLSYGSFDAITIVGIDKKKGRGYCTDSRFNIAVDIVPTVGSLTHDYYTDSRFETHCYWVVYRQLIQYDGSRKYGR